MCEAMPNDRFKWLNVIVNEFDVLSISDYSPVGYIWEIDVCYHQ